MDQWFCRVLALSVLVGCSSEPAGLTWKVTTEDDAIIDGARAFEAAIRHERCDGVVVHREVFRDEAMTPPVLPPGRYAFTVEARDASCVLVGTGCAMAELPTDAECVEVVLTAGAPDGCGAGMTCEDGVCLPGAPDATADAPPDVSVTDTGVSDTGTPDAAVDAPSDACVATSETCNGVDDDCNGVIDDGDAACADASGCNFHRIGESAYLICPDSRDWAAAGVRCEGFGYHLVVIDDLDESLALEGPTDAASSTTEHYWLGFRDEDADGAYADDEWVTTPSAFRRWRSGHPSSDASCIALHSPGADWETRDCMETHRYICEAP